MNKEKICRNCCHYHWEQSASQGETIRFCINERFVKKGIYKLLERNSSACFDFKEKVGT